MGAKNPAPLCRYCGSSLVTGTACAACRELEELDPLGASVHEPVPEAKLIAAWRPPGRAGGSLRN